jgi:hypothetical protein
MRAKAALELTQSLSSTLDLPEEQILRIVGATLERTTKTFGV